MVIARRTRALLLPLLLSSLALPSWAADADKAARYYEDALGRFEKNDVPGAVIQLKNALKEDPRLLSAQILLGRAHLRAGEPGPAEVAFEKALQLGVARSEVAVPLAQAWFDQGKYALLLERATTDGLTGRQKVEILLLRAGAHSEGQDFKEAAKALDEARRLDSQSAAVATSHAMLMLHSGNLAAAVRSADEAVRLAPKDAQAWYAKGSVQHVAGNAAAALEGYSSAIQLAPEHVDARVARAGLLLDLERLDEAGKDLAWLREKHPLDPRANYLSAVLAGKRGKAAESKALLTEVTKFVDPLPAEIVKRKPQLLLLGGLSHHGLGQFEKAKGHFETYIKLNPRHPGARKLLASIQLTEGDTAAAISTLEPAEKLTPNDPQILSLLASAYMARKQPQRAASLLERAMQPGGSAPALEASLGFTLMGAGKGDAGLAHLESAFRKDPVQSRVGMALAVEYMKRGQPKKAVEIAEAMVKRSPKNLALVNLLAVARGATGDRAGARAAYETAIGIDRRFEPAQLNFARLDLAEGKPQAARERLLALLKDAPKNTQAMFELAGVAATSGQQAQAIEWLEKARAINRQDIRIGTELVYAHIRAGNASKALDVAKELDGQHGDNLAILAALGSAHIASGRSKSARSIFDRMTTLAEYDPVAQVRIANLQLAAGNPSGAAYSLEKALATRPDYLPAQALLAETELRQGELRKAEQRARAIVERHPGEPVGHRLIGDIALARKAYAEAISAYRAALAKAPDSSVVARLMSAYFAADTPARGVEFIEEWIRAHPSDPTGLRLASEAYLRTGNPKAARTALEKALKLTPEDPVALNNLAGVLNRLGDPGDLAAAERAHQLAPDSAMVSDTLGWILVQRGQVDKGLRHLREARLRDPENPEIRYHLASALARSGRREEARQELEAAVQAAAFPAQTDARKLYAELARP